jgi:hypothetical protein
MSKRRGSGIGSRAIRGVIAGVVGTAAMDLLWYSRYRRAGGEDSFLRWEFGADVVGWADASAPGQVGQKAACILTGRQPPERWARTTTNVIHWATGIGWSVQNGVLSVRLVRHHDRLPPELPGSGSHLHGASVHQNQPSTPPPTGAESRTRKSSQAYRGSGCRLQAAATRSGGVRDLSTCLGDRPLLGPHPWWASGREQVIQRRSRRSSGGEDVRTLGTCEPPPPRCAGAGAGLRGAPNRTAVPSSPA